MCVYLCKLDKIHTCLGMYVCIYIYLYIKVCVSACLCVCVYLYNQIVYIYVRIHFILSYVTVYPIKHIWRNTSELHKASYLRLIALTHLHKASYIKLIT
jgi:hypothetical protein